MAKEIETFIGPCSKYITGQGWTTEVPVEQIEAKGYQKSAEQKAEIERLTEENKQLEEEIDLEVDLQTKRKRQIIAESQEFINELANKNAELQKQVDKLKNRFENKACCNMSENCSMIQQAVKDTAKEILQKIMNIIKKSNGFLAEEVIRIMAKQEGVEVE